MKRYIKFIVLYLFICPLLLYPNDDITEKNGLFTVVIDAGHGGKDPGGMGSRAKEKDIALAIALKTGAYIEENLKNVKVIYTRTTDIAVGLKERAEIANKNKAQLFISVHVNYNPNPKPYGTSTHVMGFDQTDENFEVAKRENSVILLEDDYETKYQNFDPNNPESYIIFSVMQNTYLNQSVEAAALVQKQFRERARRKDRGVKQQALMVLAQSSMPGILIETGFISNPTEELYLMSPEGQDYLASAIYRAFKEYKKAIEAKSNFQFARTNDSIEEKNINSEENTVSPVKYTEGQPAATKGLLQTDSSVNNITPKQNILDKEEKTDITNINIEDTSIVFRVQISSSYARIDSNAPFFRGIKPIDIYETDGMFKYVTGKEHKYKNIQQYLESIKDIFPDAFIIAVKRGRIISMQQAFHESGLKNDNIN